MMREWRRQVSQDAEVTKGGLRVAWLVAELPDGCLLDNAAIGAATGMHAHSVANAIAILRGLGHVACRGVTIDGRRLRLIRPAYLRGGGDVVMSDPDALEPPIVPPVSDLSAPAPIAPEPTSLEQNTGPVLELSGDAVTPSVERSDPEPVSGSVSMHASREAIRYPDDPVSMPWQWDIEDAWERDLRQWKLPLRCQQLTCDRPTAFLCLETQQGFCRRHKKHAIVPVSLSITELSEL
jgi:hypothetical protein